jgi:phosphatidylglycerol:prolipoprotein diacylglycerol transferase
VLLLVLLLPLLGIFGLSWDPIEIPWDPSIATFGPFELTWHGVFTAIGIAAGVYVGVMIGRKEGFTEDDGYAIALVGVPAGIIGARLLWVIENREQIDSFGEIFRINEGGITVMGSIIAAVIACVIYGLIRRMPITRGLDAAIFGALTGMAIGRIGDLINGEHIAKNTDLPWGVIYTHPDSPGFPYSATPTGFIARHPAATYEMIGDILIIGILALVFQRVWKHRPGIVFFLGVVLYSAMRFGVSYLRIDSCPSGRDCPEYIIQDWMTFPQVVSMITFFIGLAGLIWSVLRSPQEAPKEPAAATPPASGRATARA